MSQPDPFVSSLRATSQALPESGIVRVMNYGMGREGLIPLWAGEGDVPTPDFISDAAHRSMLAGETFYTHQRGIPELRDAIARYLQRLYGRAQDPERIFVTGSGMQAIQIAIQAVAGPGDEVVIPTPAWPNFAAAAEISGARPVCVPFDFGPDGWQLDLDRLLAACGPRTRALFINSPANPTGWTISADEIDQILAFVRERDIWLIADEVYSRFYYKGDLA
ncbi:MAG: aminotransferase class I/II-fold pyridoxal phosphate-dependent enzyme, partial [Methyloligellaceae bacterium]